MFRYEKDMERVMQAKKREVLKELETAKERILKELSGVDKATLTRLRQVLADYNKIDYNLTTRLDNFEDEIRDTIKNLDVNDDALIKSLEALTKSEEAVTKSEEAVTKSEEALTKSEEAVTKSEEALTKSDDALQIVNDNVTVTVNDKTFSLFTDKAINLVASSDDTVVGVSSSGLFTIANHMTMDSAEYVNINGELIETAGINSIVYGDKFVAVCDYGNIIYSENGFDWYLTKDLYDDTLTIEKISYANGLYFCHSKSNGFFMAYSYDGISWIKNTTNPFYSEGICYGTYYDEITGEQINGYLTFDYEGNQYVSSDGINWSIAREHCERGKVSSNMVCFKDYLYCAVGNILYYNQWQDINITEIRHIFEGANAINKLVVLNDRLYALAKDTHGLYFTEDGENWIEYPVIRLNSGYSHMCVNSDSIFVTASNHLYKSTPVRTMNVKDAIDLLSMNTYNTKGEIENAMNDLEEDVEDLKDKLSDFKFETLTITANNSKAISNPGGLIKSRCFAFLQSGTTSAMFIAYYNELNGSYYVAPIKEGATLGYMATNSSGQLAIWNVNESVTMHVTLIYK